MNGIMTNNLTFNVGNAETMLNNPTSTPTRSLPAPFRPGTPGPLTMVCHSSTASASPLPCKATRRPKSARDPTSHFRAARPGGYRRLMRQDRLPLNEHHGVFHRGRQRVVCSSNICLRTRSRPSPHLGGRASSASSDSRKPPNIDRARVPVTASMIRSLCAQRSLRSVASRRPRSSVVQRFGAGPGAAIAIPTTCCSARSTIAERAIDARSEAGALRRATEIAYQEIFDVLNETEHRHLIRIWNYLPEINAQAGGDERYRHFNSARQMAFRKSGRATMGSVPAASALGSPAGSPLSIYFLAARRPPKMIENPRQTSAYHYPPKFGRHSPIFSRACVWGESGSGRLFVSGTASIVGHETIHRGDVVAQTRETMVNIGALLEEANRIVGPNRYSVERPEAQSVRAQTVGSARHRGHLVGAAAARGRTSCICKPTSAARICSWKSKPSAKARNSSALSRLVRKGLVRVRRRAGNGARIGSESPASTDPTRL